MAHFGTSAIAIFHLSNLPHIAWEDVEHAQKYNTPLFIIAKSSDIDGPQRAQTLDLYIDPKRHVAVTQY